MTYKPGEVDYAEELSIEELTDMSYDGVAECMDGCRVEPDGQCEHGYSSPLVLAGII